MEGRARRTPSREGAVRRRSRCWWFDRDVGSGACANCMAGLQRKGSGAVRVVSRRRRARRAPRFIWRSPRRSSRTREGQRGGNRGRSGIVSPWSSGRAIPMVPDGERRPRATTPMIQMGGGETEPVPEGRSLSSRRTAELDASSVRSAPASRSTGAGEVKRLSPRRPRPSSRRCHPALAAVQSAAGQGGRAVTGPRACGGGERRGAGSAQARPRCRPRRGVRDASRAEVGRGLRGVAAGPGRRNC